RKKPVEMLLADFDEKLGDVAAGIVDQHVERRKPGEDFLHGLRVGDVADNRFGFSSPALYLGHCLLELARGAGKKQHFGARLRESERARAADAAAGAAHERGAAIEAKARSDVQRILPAPILARVGKVPTPTESACAFRARCLCHSMLCTLAIRIALISA